MTTLIEGRTISTWQGFKEAWDGVHNFMVAGECIPFEYELPPLSQIVDELRQHPESSIGPGVKGRSLNLGSIAEEFRNLPLQNALQSHFSIAHYHLSVFDAPGKCLHGFKECVLDRWQAALRSQGFTWERCYPIIFISGADCATNYHMDFSNVLAWQVYGKKRFCGLRDPDRWAPHSDRLNYKANDFPMPHEVTTTDALCYDMHPGEALWNALLTPHWVEASNEVAMSINISHGGLRLNGRLCRNEQELEDYRASCPDAAPGKIQSTY